MLDRKAMFAHGAPMVRITSPDEICHACHRDAEARQASHGAIPCPACGDRLHYRLRGGAGDSETAIYAYCRRAGCITILG